jgi:GTP-binding protein
MQAEFVVSATEPERFPAEDLPEVAFLGRSNVGKSSLLNALAGRPGLAFVSSTPGRTQGINFYNVDGRFQFVDLPGYGYAKVPERIRGGWQRLIESYLAGRKTLELSFLLLDARRGWMEKDLELSRWLEFHGRRFLVIATKADKLKSQKEKSESMAAIRAHLNGSDPLPFSARTGRGVREIWQAITTIRTSSKPR